MSMDGVGAGGTGRVPVAGVRHVRRAATMLSLLLLAFLVGAGLVVVGLPRDDAPTGALVEAQPSATASPSDADGPVEVAQLLATPSSRPLLGGAADPAELPRFPGASLVAYDEGVDGSVSWVVVEYLAADATLDDVREHYRQIFRETDWFVGDVDYREGVWTFTLSRGTREARLELFVEGEAVRTVAFVSDAAPAVAARATPAPAKVAPATKPEPDAARTPRAQQPPRETRTRPQTRDDDRPRPAPERRPDRDRDDDDGGNDDGDDDDDDDDDDD